MYGGEHIGREAPLIVRETLEAQGFGWLEVGNRDHVLRGADMGFGSSEYYELLGKPTFRKLLRFLISRKDEGPFTAVDLAKRLRCNEPSLQEYLEVLRRARLATSIADRWSLDSDVDNFGPTFEWYVATVFNKRLHWHAANNVHLEDTPFNDFDVVAVRGPEIVVVECKTTAPKDISEDQVGTFFERHEFLGPTLSLFLVDTTSPIKDMAAMADEYLNQRYKPATPFRPTDDREHLFWGRRNLYIANTEPGVLRTLQSCLRHYHTQVRGRSFWG